MKGETRCVLRQGREEGERRREEGEGVEQSQEGSQVRPSLQ